MTRNQMTMPWKLSLTTLTLALVSCTAQTDGGPPGAIPITFGAAISRTGSSAVDTWANSFELAAADANEGLELARYPMGSLHFRSVVVDSVNRADVAARKTMNMVRNDNIRMVLNGTSADSTALVALNHNPDVTQRPNIPVVCVACSSPSHHNPKAMDANPVVQAAYRNEDRWHFGLSMSSTPQSLVLARIITSKGDQGDVNGDGKLKVSTIHIDDAFGNGFATVLQQAILRFRPDAIIERLSHPPANELLNDLGLWSESMRLLTDDRTGEARDVRPDIVLEITFPQYSLAILKAYASGGYQVPFLHTHSMREKTVVIQAGRSLNGHEGTSYLPLDGESGRLFDERFVKTVGISRQSQWDAHVYDGYFLTALATLIAAKENSTSTELYGYQIRDAMLKVNDPSGAVIRPGPQEFARAAGLIAAGQPINYEGASGSCDFDDYGRALNRISHWSVDQQQVNDLAVYDCASNPVECPKAP
jgi:hypothetical protein